MFPCVNLANGPCEYVFPNITHQKQLKYKIMASIRKLTVCSYNMRGFNSSKINYVTDLLGRYDILVLQEHRLNNNQLANFNGYFPGYCEHVVSALDSSKILLGRPHGGVLMIYPGTFVAKAKFISLFHYLYICLILYYIYFVCICHVILTMIVILMNIIQFYKKFQHYV